MRKGPVSRSLKKAFKTEYPITREDKLLCRLRELECYHFK
jgi:hypothetical protein